MRIARPRVIPDPAISRVIKTIALIAFALCVVVDAGGCAAGPPMHGRSEAVRARAAP